jgi:periplasmic divalent cation tolerance protein
MAEHLTVTTTVDSREAADHIAEVLLERKLAACVQVEGPIESIYRWHGEVEQAREWRCTIKTRADLYESLEAAIRETHPYKTPEILAQAVVYGSREYLAWIDESVRR